MDLRLDGDGAFPELAGRDDVIVVDNDSSWTVARLSAGMQSGAPSIVLRLELPDGRTVLAETSQALWVNAAHAFEARSEYERERDRMRGNADREGHL